MGTDAAGNAVVLWVEYPDFESAGPVRTRTFDIATRSWSTVEELAPNGYSHPALTVDRAGNAAVAWATDRVQLVTVRRPVGGSWTALPTAIQCDQPYIAADGRGNITLLWQRIGRMFSTRWQAEPAAPTVNGIDSGNGSVTIDFSPPAVLEPAFASQNVEHSLDDGVTWTARTPSSMHSPLAVSGLSNGQLHQLRLRVVNAAGPGTASQPETTVAGLGSPQLLDPAVSGQTVTLRWTAPSGFSPTSYLLEAGSTPGDTIASLHSTETTLTLIAPTGVFYVRVRALVGKTRSPASNEMPLVVGLPAVPSAPVGLLGLANNAELNLVWRNTFAGGLATGLLLEVTGDRTATRVLPPTDRFRFDGVPPGTYTFAVRAFNATGSSGASNAVTLTFPGSCSPPAVPTAFSASSNLRTVVLSWLPPAAGAAPSAYVVSVSGSLTGSFETTALGASGSLGAGTYTVSVQAVNVCGASPHTPAQTLMVP